MRSRYDIWQKLTPHGQKICWAITAEPGAAIQGAGQMHPASAHRARLSGNEGFWAQRREQQRKLELGSQKKAKL